MSMTSASRLSSKEATGMADAGVEALGEKAMHVEAIRVEVVGVELEWSTGMVVAVIWMQTSHLTQAPTL